MRIRPSSRFERRSRARQQRIQSRLARVQRGAPARSLKGPARLALFAVSLLVGLGLARVVTATAVSWWSGPPTALTNFAVQGTQRLSSQDVAEHIARLGGAQAQALHTEDLEAAASEHPWIRRARVAVLPTGTVIVDVEERQPYAVLRAGADAGLSGEDRAYFVDPEGVAFAVVDPSHAAEASSLPMLWAASPGDSPPLQEVLAVIDRLEGLALPGLAQNGEPHRGLALRLPQTGSESGFVLARSDGSTEVILGHNEEAVLERLERLERMLAAGLGELEETHSIDLRFAGQAVLRTKGASD